MDNQSKSAYSVSEMCRLLKMSRTQFYEHLKKGTFHEPGRLPNNRPFFTASQVADNLNVKEMGVGINGEYTLFYSRSSPAIDTNNKNESKSQPISKNKHSDLISSLKSLGLNPTSKEVENAVEACYPNGSDRLDETDVLRMVFRHLKRLGVA